MPATSPRWSKTWLRYVGWADITISSDEEEIVNDLQRNTKMMKSGERGAERRVYVIPPGLFFVDVDYQVTIPRHGGNVHLFTQEFEVGLPYRFQLAYENNIEVRGGHTQVTLQNIEARYALANWGVIPLNPTLFAEYKIGVGKDYERQAGTHDPVPHI